MPASAQVHHRSRPVWRTTSRLAQMSGVVARKNLGEGGKGNTDCAARGHGSAKNTAWPKGTAYTGRRYVNRRRQHQEQVPAAAA
jgi:hypothetical protein